MTVKYEIEIGMSSESSQCHCCDKDSYNGHGFMYKNNDAYAVYYASYSKEYRSNFNNIQDVLDSAGSVGFDRLRPPRR